MIADVWLEASVISVMSDSDNEVSGPAESSCSNEVSAGAVTNKHSTVGQTAVSVSDHSDQSAKHKEG